MGRTVPGPNDAVILARPPIWWHLGPMHAETTRLTAVASGGRRGVITLLGLTLGVLPAAPLSGAWLQAGAGVVSGTVELNLRPPRRQANRYPSGKVGAAKLIQQLPPVVYLRGDGLPDGAASLETIAQQDTAFLPSVLAVPLGSTVAFENRDDFFHNVFSYSTFKRFDLGRYPKGQSKSVTFDEPGIVKIYCEVHDFMRATVLVLDHAYHSTVAEDGSFLIAGVPPGEYELVAWHVDLKEQVVSVSVASGQTSKVELTLR